MEPQVSIGYIAPLFQLAFNLLVVFYRLLGENLGLAIIVFTLFVRFLTLPFAIRQVRSAKKNQEFQSKYKEVQSKHKEDRDTQMKELGKLQAEYLPGQLGGCLPMILNILFFFQVFFVINNILPHSGVAADFGTKVFNSINYSFVPDFSDGYVINTDFIGINLGKSASGIGLGNLAEVWPYLVLIILVGITTFISGRVTAGMSLVPKFGKGQSSGSGKGKDKSKDKQDLAEKAKRLKLSERERKQLRKEKSLSKDADEVVSSKDKDADKPVKLETKERASSKDHDHKDVKKPEDLDFSSAMQQSSQQMLYILPIIQMLISFAFPAGLSLYSTVSGGFAIIQQLIVHRDKVADFIKNQRAKYFAKN